MEFCKRLDSIIDDYVSIEKILEGGIDYFSQQPYFPSFATPMVEVIKDLNSKLQEHSSALTTSSYICSASSYFCGSNFLVNSAASIFSLALPPHAMLASIVPIPVIAAGSILYIGINAYKAHCFGNKYATITSNILEKIDTLTKG